MKKWMSLLVFSCFILIIGCAPREQGNQKLDYEETKKMVVDILKTDEGKKAIEEMLTDEKMKQNLVINQDIVTKSIQDTLLSEDGITFWKKNFEDPKFVETFAKSMQEQHEKVIKDLMKDPEYQKMMIEILKNPEMEEAMVEVLRSQEMRAHIQTVITETIESPLFKAKMQDLLIKGAEEIQANKDKKKEEGGGES
ncbi:spore gernimation protein GerD [Bacillus luteolus]|uniref:Spore gernimation protein GerD n=1 Tax=Litchfieldia luteola TaxID=682179 RepID=A0ABR9QDK8_9BACI|nr:spore germination lipoprotein GerD [Cytobacillus luteolus]MBE4906566.1 spore gernimation protein GerD [Cytobacillus luteolus]MBP1944668.1 spore germination protein D [Cytobacillus luteolus]